MGNAHPSIAPHELYDTGQGALVIAVGNDRQFATLCQVLGAPALATDPRYATKAERVSHREALRADLERRIAERAAADWAEELTEVRVPAGVLNDLAGAFELAAALELDPVVDVPREECGAVRLTGNPIVLSATPASYRSGPPRLGAGQRVTAPE
jgi:crotonobetainyl-CoA:carnitine CoA-transferase CaiB-like acyl-CoA transferase